MDWTNVIFCSKVPWNWMAVYKFSRISIQWQCFRLHLCLELVPLSSNRSSRRKSTTDSGRLCSRSKRKRLCKHTLAETTKAQKSHKGHVVLGIVCCLWIKSDSMTILFAINRTVWLCVSWSQGALDQLALRHARKKWNIIHLWSFFIHADKVSSFRTSICPAFYLGHFLCLISKYLMVLMCLITGCSTFDQTTNSLKRS